MKKIDLHAVDGIIRAVAQTEIMPRFRKLAEGDVEMKGVNDPVTVADKETERRLTEDLTAYLPGSLVVGEESFAKDKSIMQRIESDQPIWIIDPIDGTRNFVSGHPEFAVMVGLVTKKKTIASWIHDPNSGDTVMAEQGAGVWLGSDKLKLTTDDQYLPVVGLVGTRIKKFLADPELMPHAASLPNIEIGSCAGFDYPRLFTGTANYAKAQTTRARFLIYRHTNAWDHIPGHFLHQEAGGYSADWAGQPYDMTMPRSGLLYAANQDEWNELHRAFRPLIEHTAKALP
jgi:fructose-1,6-bisphosphatase/inositol monophosphatase family enzyme